MFPNLFVSPAIFGLPAFSASAIPATDLTVLVVLAIGMVLGFVGILGRLWLQQRTTTTHFPSRPRPTSRSLGTLPIGTAAARPSA